MSSTRLMFAAAFLGPALASAQPADPAVPPATSAAEPLDEAKVREIVDREVARASLAATMQPTVSIIVSFAVASA